MMGHYDLNAVIIRMSGVFSGSSVGVRQDRIKEELDKFFQMDIEKELDDSEWKEWETKWKKRKESEEFIWVDQLLRHLRAFVSGKFVGEGWKGDVFCHGFIGNYSHNLVQDWVALTKYLPDTFPPTTVITACENGGPARIEVVYNGKILRSTNFWDAYGLFDKF